LNKMVFWREGVEKRVNGEGRLGKEDQGHPLNVKLGTKYAMGSQMTKLGGKALFFL